MKQFLQPAWWLGLVLWPAPAALCQPGLTQLGASQSSKPAGAPLMQLAEAKSLYSAGKYGPAERAALQYLAQAPQSSQAMYLIAHTCEREKKAKESLEWFTKAAALAQPTGEDLRTVGLDYVMLNDYPDAVHWLERAVAYDAQNGEAWYDLGRAQMTQGDAAAAEKDLTRALQLKPRLVKAENNLGVVYETENRVDDAIAAYRLAIAWQSGSPQPSEQPLLNLGTLLITDQRGREAVALLQQAVAIAPENAKAHEQLARAEEQSGDLAEALLQMQAAIGLDGNNPRLHFELGQMYRRAGKVEEAARELRLSGQLYGSHSTSPDQ